MNIIETIRAEIERRIESIAKAPSDGGVMDSILGAQGAQLMGLIQFIDTLPEQPKPKPKAIVIRPAVNLQKELMGVSAEVKDAVMLLLKDGWSLKAPDSEREFDQRAVCAGISSIPPKFKLDVKPEQPVEYPTSTEMIAEWENNELPLLRDKDFRGDAERMAYNAFMDGFAKGLGYKK